MAFYSHDILHRKGGKFGKIWVAATKVVKLTRREVASVNIPQSCEDVLKYLDGGYDRPRGRLSLYLSTFLMYGLVRIYYKQAEYLLTDAESVFVRVQHIPRFDKNIDLKDAPRADLVTQTEQLGYPDIDYEFYMVMEELDRPDIMLPPMEGWALESQSRSPSGSRSSAGLSRKSRSKPRKDRRSASVQEPPPSPHTVTSIDQITLTDPPPVLIHTPLSPIPVPKDLELPMMPGQDMDLTGMGAGLGLAADEPRLAVKDLLPASTPIGTRTPDRSTRHRDQQTTLESPSKQVQSETREKTPDVPARTQQVPPTPPRVGPRTPEVTQVIAPSPDKGRKEKRKSRRLLTLDPHIEIEPAPPQRKRQKRPHRLVDTVTQIPKAQIKKNLTTTKNIVERFQVPDSQGVDSTDWMCVPGRREHRRPPFNLQWSRGAVFRRNLQESDLPRLSSPESGQSSEVEGQQPGVGAEGQQMGVDGAQLGMDGFQLEVEGQQGQGTEGARGSSEEEMFIATRLPPMPELERMMAEGAAQEPSRAAEDSIQMLRQISATGEGLEISEIEMPSVEVARDHSSSQILDQGGLNISDAQIPMEETSKRSDTSASKRSSKSRKSRDDSMELQPTPAKSHTSLQTSSLGLGGLYNIVEEAAGQEGARVELPLQEVGPAGVGVGGLILEEQEMGDGGNREEELLRLLTEELAHQTSSRTTFRKLCPVEQATRKQAARLFTALLGLCAKRKVKAKQKTSYGDIYIAMANQQQSPSL